MRLFDPSVPQFYEATMQDIIDAVGDAFGLSPGVPLGDFAYQDTTGVDVDVTFLENVHLSTAKRLFGDFSNATPASRTLLQTATLNGNTNVGVIPNGSSSIAAFRAYNSSLPNDSSFIQFSVSATTAVLASDIVGTGAYIPLTFQTGGLNRIQITTGGRTLLGATLPTDDTLNNLQVSGGLSVGAKITGRLTVQNGQASLVVGADSNGLTLTDAMTKNGSMVTPHYTNAEEPVMAYAMNSFSTTSFLVFGGGIANFNAATQVDFYTAATNTTLVGTIGMRLNSASNVAFGPTNAPTGTSVYSAKNITGTTGCKGIQQAGIVQSDVTSNATLFTTSGSGTAAATFTLPILIHYQASQGTFGAGSTITNQYGFTAEATLIGGTNNYGFFGAIAAGTNRWNFYANGTAMNYFAGKVLNGSNIDNGLGLMQIRQAATNSSLLTLHTTDVDSSVGIRWTNDARVYQIYLDGSADSFILRDVTASRNLLAFNTSGVGSFGGSISLAAASAYQINGIQVVNARKTGWATATGAATRTTFDTTTVTLPQLAERVKALIDDLHATAGHGLIGT